MEKLMSASLTYNLCRNPPCETIPVIDLGRELGSDRGQLIKQIIQASQEFGFFQLINHWVPEKLMYDVLDAANQFLDLPVEDKARLYSEDPKQSCRLYTSIDYDRETVHCWRDNQRFSCHPLEEQMNFWPEKPPHFRNMVGRYSAEGDFSRVQLMAVNYYPACSDPSLTLGLPKHSDVNLITHLLQGEVHGLQVLKDGKWLAVEPLPNAFVVNIGHTLQIISNGI